MLPRLAQRLTQHVRTAVENTAYTGQVMEGDDVEDDLRTMVREFRESVSGDLSVTHRQMRDLANEVRQRLTTAETALLNALRDHALETDRRFTRLEQDVVDLHGRLDGLDGRLDGLDGRLDGLDGRLDGLDGRLTGRLDDVQASLARIEDALSG
jgi:chromosome segregation ATPase